MSEAPLLLIVDDHEPNRRLLARRLQREGYRTLEAEGGAQALALVADTRPSLMLLDIMMPGMSGLEVLRRIRETHLPLSLPVIMVSALDESGSVVEALHLGANDYVTKPIDYPVVQARVRIQLRLKALHDFQVEAVHIASHDLKNPLAAILGSAQVLEHLLPPGAVVTPELHEAIGAILRSGRRMQDLIHDFLDGAFDLEGGVSLRTTPTDLGALLGRIVGDHTSRAQEKSITIDLELDACVPPQPVDPERIAQVLDNLVGNAVKFSPAGASVTARLRLEEQQVVFQVVDEGPGVGADPDRLFEKFVTGAARPTGEEVSTGLGLSIVRKMVALHGGTVSARDNSGGPGATFEVRLPGPGAEAQ